MAVIAVAEMFGISGRREELTRLPERFERRAGGEPGCRRYVFAAALADPSRFGARRRSTPTIAPRHSPTFSCRSTACSHDRASKLTVYSLESAVRPTDTRLVNPRDPY